MSSADETQAAVVIAAAEWRRDHGPADGLTDSEAARIAQEKYERALGWGCD